MAEEKTFREQVEAAEAADRQTSSPPPPADTQSAEAPTQSEIEPESPGESSEPSKEPETKDAVYWEKRYNASHRERKDLRIQARQQQEKIAELERQQQQIAAWLQAQQQQSTLPPPPDPATDPLGAQRFEIQRTAAEVAALRQSLGQREQVEAQQRATQQLVAHIDQREKAFAKENADYFDAVTWARQERQRQYEAVGVSSAEAAQRVNADAMDLVRHALANGDDPAVIGYQLAKTMGYKPKPAAAAEKLAMQSAGQKAALPSGTPGSSGGRLSLEALAGMNGKDFLEATKGDNWKRMRSVLGG